MPINRNALVRYRVIDQCLRNRQRSWTLEDLIDACSDALYEYEGIDKGVSKRTVQADIEVMRSGKLGYEAPIVVLDRKFYTYSNKDFTITNIPLDAQDLAVLMEASALLKQFKGLSNSADLNVMITKLEDKIYLQRTQSAPVIDFERNDDLTGLHWIETLRSYVVERKCVSVTYKSFRAKESATYPFSPYLLKEYRNRWFVLGTAHIRGTPLYMLALDRIEDLAAPRDETIPFIENSEVDVTTYFKDVIGVTRSLKDVPTKVVFTINAENAPYLITKPMHSSQQIIESEGPDVMFSINVILNFELERELLGHGDSIEVLRPRILRKRIGESTTKAAKKYA